MQDQERKRSVRCGAIKLDRFSGEKIQCEGLRGHHSAHYSNDEWWPNPNGYPNNMGQMHRGYRWLALGFAAFCLAVVILAFWIALR
ncbi:MAG TPA: hypothetical protein VM574_07930 [Terrimicrobiaceae bacterium]|jgi:hypothetical protein|nr:hypothetical protein [Terrimicrobiaceae bacterium]